MPGTRAPQPRSVLITGASRGIGWAIAERFVAAGDRVASLQRSTTVPDGVLAVRGDVRDSDSVDAAFGQVEQAHGPVEVLVANAGITRDGLLMRMSDEDFDAVLDTNLTGAFRVARRAATSMVRGRSGRIVFISSVIGLSGGPGQTNYAASKAGLVGFARAITHELGGRGITANVVAPGFVETDMTRDLPDEVRQRHLSYIPAGRWGEPHEVAAVVEFLASPAAAYVTGAVVPVDGGMGMGH